MKCHDCGTKLVKGDKAYRVQYGDVSRGKILYNRSVFLCVDCQDPIDNV